MKWPQLFEPVRIFAEIRPGSIHVWTGESGWDLPLERTADGRITPECARRISAAIQNLATGQSWVARVRVYCAIPARGVVLRTLSLPVGAAATADVDRLIPLQIEGEFPLPPDALAWGWTELNSRYLPAAETPSNAGRHPVLVAAIRKEIITDYAALFQGLDPNPTFTPAAFVRLGCLSGPWSEVGLLDLGPTHSEFSRITAQASPGIQSLAWGTQAFEPPKAPNQAADPASSISNNLAGAEPETARIGAWLAGALQGAPLWIVGPPEIPGKLRPYLSGPTSIRTIEIPQRPGITAATWGWRCLQEEPERLAGIPMVTLQSQPAIAKTSPARDWPRKELAIAAVLLVSILLFPYLEAWLLQPGLARRLQGLRARQSQLAVIDQETSFFRYLEQNQAPQLDATFVIAQAAPPGTHLDQLTMNRQGSVNFSGYLRDLNQVGEFRLKLIQSGFFSTVVAEDQTQTPDRQRVNFRITAQWKDVDERDSLNLGPTLPPTNAPRSGLTNSPGPTPNDSRPTPTAASNAPAAKPSPSSR